MSSSYLTQALHRARRYYPERLATVCGGRRQTYAALVDRVARFAGGLQQLGMAKGDRVGILSQNSDRYLEAYYATWWGGGVVNPINIRWSAREIAYTLDDSDTRILIVDDSFAAMVGELSQLSKSLRVIVHAGECAPGSGIFDFEQIIADSSTANDALRANHDLAGIFYTGGTTGFPKGVMLSHGGLLGSTMGVIESLTQPGDVGLHAAPMFHLADGAFMLALTLRGCRHVMLPAFQPERVLQTIQDQQVSNVLLVPTMIQMLVDHPNQAQFKLDSLQRIAYGASPISEGLLDRAMARLPQVKFMQAYGLTEMSPIVSVLDATHHSAIGRKAGKLRSAGQVAICAEVKIVDADGREVPSGTVGEIAARGPGVMLGYWNNPAQTSAALRNGWLHTGDSAYLDDDGFLYIVDRLKDMIVSGGENIYSAEVENALSQHAAVAACAVIGIPSAQWGETVLAVIVCKPGVAMPGEDELKAHCRERIASYKCPRAFEFRDALPLSGAGKVLKTQLREAYWKDQQRRVA